MNFNKTTSYSISVLSFMAANTKKRMSANELHDKLKIPYSYLRQVLGDLSKSGFISGSKGKTGGFVFVKSADKVFLSDIIDATEGLESFDKCIMGFSECPFSEQCPMHPVWEKTRNEILKVLNETSLAGLLKK